MAQLFSLGHIAHHMKLLSLIFCAYGCVMCFSLAIRSFSVRGVPVTRTRMLTGLPAVIIGIGCALLCILFLVWSIMAARELFVTDVRY